MITTHAPALTSALNAVAGYWSGAHPAEYLEQEERLKLLEALIVRIESERSDASPLAAPALQDPDPRIASSAALAYITLSPPVDGDVTAAARVLVECVKLGRAESPGGVFAGILAVGDRRIVRYLFTERGALRREDIPHFAKTKTGFVHAASVEFWIDWLDTLPGDLQDLFFGRVAAGLVNERMDAVLPFVDDIERVYPAWLAPEMPIRVLRSWTLSAYAQHIAPRLRAIREKEEEPRVMDDVMWEWGVYP